MGKKDQSKEENKFFLGRTWRGDLQNTERKNKFPESQY